MGYKSRWKSVHCFSTSVTLFSTLLQSGKRKHYFHGHAGLTVQETSASPGNKLHDEQGKEQGRLFESMLKRWDQIGVKPLSVDQAHEHVLDVERKLQKV